MKHTIAWLLLFAAFYNIPAETPDGFAIYSKGDGSNRALHMVTLKPGWSEAQISASEKLVCAKGSAGGDIQAAISFDGSWLAFARSRGGNGGGYGGDDYHDFSGWDVYIASLSGTFPATPKLVGRGYFPSWGEDSYGATKTLYYTTAHDNKTIRAVTIDASGNLSNDRKVVDINTGGGFEDFTMAAPNGHYYAARYSGHMHAQHYAGALAGQRFAIRDGCQPHVTADSKWIVHAKFTVGRDNGSKNIRPITGLSNCGWDCLPSEGAYSFGSSSNMKWFITWTYGNWQEQNKGMPVHLFKLNATDSEFAVSRQIKITNSGGFPDVHEFEGPKEVSISFFSATPAAITSGSSTTLAWQTSYATAVTIDGAAVATTGTKALTPTATKTYKLEATDGTRTVFKEVSVTVAAPVATTLSILPTTATLYMGKPQALTATLVDQSGNLFAGDISWSAQGGSLSVTTGTAVTYSAGQAPGVYTVTATHGTLSTQCRITILDPNALHLRINSGGPDVSESGVTWTSAGAAVSGGADYDFNAAASNLSALTDPAPAAVYRTVRHQGHSYSFTDVPNGAYRVRLHFIDQSPGARSMVYKIEGTTVLTGFDLGTAGVAQIKEYTVSVSDGNGMQIAAETGAGNDVFEAGIEVIKLPDEQQVAGPQILDDHASKTYSEGQSVTVRWSGTAEGTPGGAGVAVSPDDGDTWHNVYNGSISFGTPNWGSVVVPLKAAGVSLVSTQVRLIVYAYSNPEVYSMTEPFTIVESSSVSVALAAPGSGRSAWAARGADGRVTVRCADGAAVKLWSINGRASIAFTHDATGLFRSVRTVGSGLYLLSVQTPTGVQTQRLVSFR